MWACRIRKRFHTSSAVQARTTAGRLASARIVLQLSDSNTLNWGTRLKLIIFSDGASLVPALSYLLDAAQSAKYALRGQKGMRGYRKHFSYVSGAWPYEAVDMFWRTNSQWGSEHKHFFNIYVKCNIRDHSILFTAKCDICFVLVFCSLGLWMLMEPWVSGRPTQAGLHRNHTWWDARSSFSWFFFYIPRVSSCFSVTLLFVYSCPALLLTSLSLLCFPLPDSAVPQQDS